MRLRDLLWQKGKWATIALVPLCLGSAAQAGFALPAGCEAYVTAQSKSCRVSHYFTCEIDPEGHQRRVDIDINGPYFVSRIDAEGQWIEGLNLRGGRMQYLGPEAKDPASFSELLASGRDSFDFQQITQGVGPTRVQGFDRLTGESVTIDGVTLEVTEFDNREITMTGTVVSHNRGREFIHREWRVFIGGKFEFLTDEGYKPFDRTPMRFDFPGDAGFLSDMPAYDCDPELAGIAPLNTAEPELTVQPVHFASTAGRGFARANPKE